MEVDQTLLAANLPWVRSLMLTRVLAQWCCRHLKNTVALAPPMALLGLNRGCQAHIIVLRQRPTPEPLIPRPGHQKMQMVLGEHLLRHCQRVKVR